MTLIPLRLALITLAMATTTAHAEKMQKVAENNGSSSPYELAIKKLENENKIPKLDYTDSIGGIDADNDGVRDDLNQILSKEDVTPEELKAIVQSFKAHRDATINFPDHEPKPEFFKDLYHSKKCLDKVLRPEVKDRIYRDKGVYYWGNTKARHDRSKKIYTQFFDTIDNPEYRKHIELKPGYTGCHWVDAEYERQLEMKKKRKYR